MVDWVVSRRVNESCYVGSLTRRGLALVRGLVASLTFEASSCPLCDMLEQRRRRWIACRWSNLMQLATWGSATSVHVPFRCRRTLVVPIEGG
jgi:hypothetical protein